MTKIFLALGSNVGDSEGNIARAIEMLKDQVVILQVAPLCKSKAVGYTEQADFINTALVGTTSLDPQELLSFVKKVEQAVGRVHRFRCGPREIDIDIIFYGDSRYRSENLTIPHPRFAERSFVLLPLVNLDSGMKDPRTGKTVAELVTQLSE